MNKEFDNLSELQKLIFWYVYWSNTLYSRGAPKQELIELTGWYMRIQLEGTEKDKALVHLVITGHMSIGLEQDNIVCRLTDKGRERAKLEGLTK